MHADPSIRFLCGVIVFLVALVLPALYNNHILSFVVGLPTGIFGVGLLATAFGDQTPKVRG